jgi:hypothetical protein
MKRQCFTEVCQKIRGAVVAGIEVKFVPDGFSLELAMEFRSAFFKPKVIFIAAVWRVPVSGWDCRGSP